MRKCQKRPICMGKETYLYGKRDLFVWEKRPICMGKETYLYGKRDLFALQMRPTNLLAYLTYAHVSKERIHTSL